MSQRDGGQGTGAGVVRMSPARRTPVGSVLRAVAAAVAVLLGIAVVVYLGRAGYRDVDGRGLTFVDCLYYAAGSLFPADYAGVTPISTSARLASVVVIMPLRVVFLVVLIGTTIRVLDERSRQAYKIKRWRSRVRDHVVVVGYGTKGRSAVVGLLGEGMRPENIIVVDTDQSAVDAASAAGLVTVQGSGTSNEVLRSAGVPDARAVVVAVARDDTAVLVTLTARELAPNAQVVASVREEENVHLLRQSGADPVVVSSGTAGRLLGLATSTPSVVEMVEDLLTPSEGLAIAEREVEQTEIGASPRHLSDIVLGVVRGGRLFRVDAPEADAIEPGDRLLYVRKATPATG
ncbi:potassium channel family protein [Gandjariella thermophila]|nr:NAD(P)-binding protein [Gandjariella thermophila]